MKSLPASEARPGAPRPVDHWFDEKIDLALFKGGSINVCKIAGFVIRAPRLGYFVAIGEVMKLSTILLNVAAVAAAFGSSRAQELPAEIIIVNANVFTASDKQPHAEAIAIEGDRIVAVGANKKIDALAGPKTKRIDAGGRLVIPGIMDTHNHYSGAFLPTVTKTDFGDWSPTCKHVLETVAQKVSVKGNLLFGSMGMDAFFDPECTPAARQDCAGHASFIGQWITSWRNAERCCREMVWNRHLRASTLGRLLRQGHEV